MRGLERGLRRVVGIEPNLVVRETRKGGRLLHRNGIVLLGGH